MSPNSVMPHALKGTRSLTSALGFSVWALAACGNPASGGSLLDRDGSTEMHRDASAMDGSMMDASAAEHDAANGGHDAAPGERDSGNDASLPGEHVVGSQTIGAAGGSLHAEGVDLVVPPGALTSEVEIRIIQTTLPIPAGYEGYSAIYRFEPDGLAFAKPLQVSLPFTGDASKATMFWSTQADRGYVRLGGVPETSALTAPVAHFSYGFVGNGVTYRTTPRRDCTVARTIKAKIGQDICNNAYPGYRPASPEVPGFPGSGSAAYCSVSLTNIPEGDPIPNTKSSAVAVLFTVDDCDGEPVPGLSTADFLVSEAVTGVPQTVGEAEGAPRIQLRDEPEVFISLVLDVSNSIQANIEAVRLASRAFVEQLHVTRKLPVAISVSAFAGGALKELAAPRLEPSTLYAAIDDVTTYQPTDPASTNLNGGLIQAIDNLNAEMKTFEARQGGGALATGYVVLFTDGADTAGLKTSAQAKAARDSQGIQVLAVGLDTPDYDEAGLGELATNGVVTAPATSTLVREFTTIASRIEAQLARTYLLGYCTPKRAGQPSVQVAVKASTTATAATFTFDATGITKPCTAGWLESACAADTCGTLGCHACDDRTDYCDKGTCNTQCKIGHVCHGDSYTNPQGYDQVCQDVTVNQRCNSVPNSAGAAYSCVDVTTSINNCSECGNRCDYGCNNSMCIPAANATKAAIKGHLTFPNLTGAIVAQVSATQDPGSGSIQGGFQSYSVADASAGLDYFLNGVSTSSQWINVAVLQGNNATQFDGCGAKFKLTKGQTTTMNAEVSQTGCDPYDLFP
ncbi:MAG: VWA domain-containing protein [Myxococcales bacterium]